MIARLLSALIADDPNPQPSWLDQMDGLSPQKPLCSHMGCPEAPVTEIVGFKLCQSHSPARV